MRKVIIIGSGPAGLTAAIYCGRAKLSPLVIAGIMPKGQLMFTTEIENFPGFPNGLLGSELMENMQKQAERFGAEIKNEDAIEVNLKTSPFTVKTSSFEEKAQAIIIATGAAAKLLGLESEKKLLGHGVSICAICDGFFFKEKEVFVIGGGDSGLEEAIFVSKFASKVTVVEFMPKLMACKTMQEKAGSNPKISFILGTTVEEILGDSKVTGIKLKNVKTGEITTRNCSGIFVAIGRKPSTEIFKGQIELDDRGYIKTDVNSKTNIPGVFAAGDAANNRHWQAIIAAGAGSKAALEAEKFLEQ